MTAERALQSDTDILAKYTILQALLEKLSASHGLILAYSGGLDSRFVAHAGQQADLRLELLHAIGPHIPPTETEYARQWAGDRGISMREMPVNTLDLPAVAAGDPARCYQCKYALFSAMKQQSPAIVLCDGTHTSDMQGFRPGLAALRELDVVSPLAVAEFSKADIRRAAVLTGLENPDQRARPCLLTRLNYGLQPTATLLGGLARAEQIIHLALAAVYGENHMPDFRLRLVAPEILELHTRPLDKAPEHADRQGNTTVANLWLQQLAPVILETCGFPLARLVEMEQLSGFFDRTNVSLSTFT